VFRPSFGGKLSRPATAAARLAGNAEMARAESGPLAFLRLAMGREVVQWSVLKMSMYQIASSA